MKNEYSEVTGLRFDTWEGAALASIGMARTKDNEADWELLHVPPGEDIIGIKCSADMTRIGFKCHKRK